MSTRLASVLLCAVAINGCAKLEPIQVIDAGGADGSTTSLDASGPEASTQDAAPVDLGAPDAPATSWATQIRATFPEEVTAAVNGNVGETTPPDLTCLGTWDYGDNVSESAPVLFLTFEQGDNVSGLRYFPNGLMPSAAACGGAECRMASFTPDATSWSTSQSQHSPFSFLLMPSNASTHVLTQWSMYGTFMFALPPEQTTFNIGELTVNQRSWYDTAQARWGSAAVPNTAHLGVLFQDCQRNFGLGNAVVRLVRDNNVPLGFGINGSTWGYVRYPTAFLSDWNAANENVSVPTGVFEAGNIPIANSSTGEVYRVEIWGRLTENAEPSVISCEHVRLLPDSMTFLLAFPKRRGSPASCN